MKILPLFLLCFLLTGCSSASVASPPLPTLSTAPSETQAIPKKTEPLDPIGDIIDSLTVEQRVGQLFLARCDDSRAMEDIKNYNFGGLILFGADFADQDPDSVQEKLAGYQAAARMPLLLAVDEEGGTVTRVSRYPAFRNRPFPSPRQAFEKGGMDRVLEIEREKCQLLKSLGLNVNMGPVCDIALEPGAFMYERSLGLGPEETGAFVAQTVELMAEHRMGSVLKHFPGYGNNADTHVDIAVDSRSLEELEGFDLRPFAAGIDAGAGAVLVSHTIVEALDPELPASLSPAVHRYLREEMGFGGVILTDDLVMEAVADQYGSGEAAVLAVLAGNDLLCSTDYLTQYDAVFQAVLTGRITMDTLDAAVRRVLEWKAELGLIDAP